MAPRPLSLRAFEGDSCGCSMGARFLTVGLIASIAWYGWHWLAHGLTIWAFAVRVLLWSFVAACAGKVVGIALYSWRHRRLRLKLLTLQ
jgi:hypothetical protein